MGLTVFDDSVTVRANFAAIAVKALRRKWAL